MEASIPVFGRLALAAGMIDMRQLKQCLAEQAEAEAAGGAREPLGKLLAMRGHMTVAQVEEILRLQQARAKAAANKSCDCVEEVAFEPEDVILRDGDDGDHDLFVLRDGAAEIRDNGRVVRRVSEKGGFLGEISAILKSDQVGDVVAVEPTRAWRIPADRVGSMLASKPAMALRLLEAIAEQANDAIASAATASDALCEAPVEQDRRQDPPSTRADAAPEPAATEQPPPTDADDAPEPDADDGMLNLGSMATLDVDDDGTLHVRSVSDRQRVFVNGETVDGRRALVDQDLVQFDKYVVQVFLDHPHLIELPDDDDEEDAPSRQGDQQPDEAEPIEAPAPPEPTGNVPVGESGGVDIDAIAAHVDSMDVVPLSDEATEAIEGRIALQLELGALDGRRDELDPPEEHAGDVEKEFSRQRREMKKAPMPEALDKSISKYETKLAKDAESDEPMPAAMKAAMEIGLAQKRLLKQRAGTTAATLAACAAAAANEPLYAVLSTHEIDPSLLFGWAIYDMTLEEASNAARGRIDEIRDALAESRPHSQETKSLTAENEALEARVSAIRRERKLIERDMVTEFWKVYEAAALALVRGVDDADEPFVRALLRRGLLGCSKRFIEPEPAKALLAQCAAPVRDVNFDTRTTCVLYADESIVLAAAGVIPNAHDEDLELKQANTPIWKADRSWRRVVNYGIQEAILRDVTEQLEQGAEEARREQETTEKKLELLNRSDPEYKAKRVALRDTLQTLKVEAVRKERLIEQLKDQMLRRLREKADASQKMLESVDPITDGYRAAGEVAFIRQQSKLGAALTEPFLPFALADSVVSTGGEMIERELLAKDIHDAEVSDPLLFCDPLIPGVKKTHRVLVRTGPIAVILPAPGSVCMAATPRCDGENGGLVMPGFFARQGDRVKALWSALSDYRYDTSKAASGVDAMTSDTLIAAYAEFRWSVRKKSREVRQKMGVYTEENDRANWRRHYEMYMKSADESGKQLFFKAPDLYESIVGKFIDLPEGGEVLKRN